MIVRTIDNELMFETSIGESLERVFHGHLTCQLKNMWGAVHAYDPVPSAVNRPIPLSNNIISPCAAKHIATYLQTSEQGERQ